MSNRVPTRETVRGKPLGHRDPLEDSGSTLEEWAGDDGLRQEMAQLIEENMRLLGSEGDSQTPLPRASAIEEEIQLILGENAELQARVAELEKRGPVTGAPVDWQTRQSEYEALLEEKTEVIRSLHQEVRELRQAVKQAPVKEPAKISPAEPTPGQTDLTKLKAQLDEDRKQLEADEETLMKQLRQMEMQMSKDRADLARQRAELQRLKSDLQYEIEVASRDSTLRDRLAGIQRRHQEPPAAKTESPPEKSSERE